MFTPLSFGGAANAGGRDAQGRFPLGSHEFRNGGRRWAPRTTLLLATGVSSVFWIALGWLIASKL
jgi:hypothetical protein